MYSSSASRRRRNAPAWSAPRPEGAGRAVWVPRDAPPATVRDLPRQRPAPPNPAVPRPEAVGRAVWVPRNAPPATVRDVGGAPRQGPPPPNPTVYRPGPAGRAVWVPRVAPPATVRDLGGASRQPLAPPNPRPAEPRSQPTVPLDGGAPQQPLAPPNPSPPETRSHPAVPRDGAAPLQPLAPPNPTPPETQPRPGVLPASSSSSSTSRRRQRRPSLRGRNGEAGDSAALPLDANRDGEARDWAALPLDAISCILRKLDHIDILMGAGHVCRSWRSAARDHPALWRRIDMRGHADLDRQVNLYKMAQVAIRRAQGQCEAFWAEYAADDDVLHFLGDQAPSLKSLSLIACQDIMEFEEEIKKFPLLEELEISLFTNIGGKQVFEEVGKACPELKHLKFNAYHFCNLGDDTDTEDDDSEFRYNRDDNALGIASMHGLRSLQLFGQNFTNKGLTAILDNCPHLESLDIRHCFNISMDKALRAKCGAIKTLKLPNDPMDGYDLHFEGPLWSLSVESDSEDYAYAPDYILESDDYDDYCDPFRYLDGVYESELNAEDRMFLKGMRMLMKDSDSDDDY